MTRPMPDDYTVRLIDLPISVGGRISECPDGHIDVYINARLSRDGQRRAARHEYDHWLHDDLHSTEDIRAIEGRDRRPLPPLLRARDLIPPPPRPALPAPAAAAAPVPAPAPVRRAFDDWKDDVLFSLPYMD